MNFLVDAQLPIRLVRLLSDAGHDTIHSSGLPDGNRTTDRELARLADAEDRVVVSNDRDFRNDHLLAASPRRLLLICTGNVANSDPLHLMKQHLAAVVTALTSANFVELHRSALVVHPPASHEDERVRGQV